MAPTTSTSTSTSSSTTATIPNTIAAGLSLWESPLTALQELPTAVQLLFSGSYTELAIGILLPPTALILVLLMGMGGDGGGYRGRR
jgi:hypothetical protein